MDENYAETELEYEIDYTCYVPVSKNIIDLNKVMEYDRSKPNKNNQVFGEENIYRLTYNFDNINYNDGKDSNNAQLKNG